jgi:tRNA(Ile)-lysidine synthase
VLIRALEEALGALGLRDGTLLVAVSGGVDSVVLLHGLEKLSQGWGLKLLIGHVNHGLRGEHSEADQRFVEELGARLSIPCEVARVEPASLIRDRSSRDRPTPQEAARTLRWRALEEMAGRRGARWIATAHQADDQAETVLLRLLRGTGPDGLGGIPERSPDGRRVRPLLGVSRAEIERFARQNHLTWREDASNGSDDYARNRLRRHWLPGLAQDFNPSLLRAIGNLAEAQRQDSRWISSRVEQEAGSRLVPEDGWLRIDAKDWAALPEALARRLARAALERCGAGRLVTRVHLERMGEFLARPRTGKTLELPGDLQLVCTREGFRLGPLPAADEASSRATTQPPDAC